jgi:hypothetical protein
MSRNEAANRCPDGAVVGGDPAVIAVQKGVDRLPGVVDAAGEVRGCEEIMPLLNRYTKFLPTLLVKSDAANVSPLESIVAEREGFEPPIPVKVWPLSRRLVSTTHAPLRINGNRIVGPSASVFDGEKTGAALSV